MSGILSYEDFYVLASRGGLIEQRFSGMWIEVEFFMLNNFTISWDYFSWTVKEN